MSENTAAWKGTLSKAAALFDKSSASRKQASGLLWTGAQEAITDWTPRSDDDVSGEGLYSDLLEALGKGRKGDASKIRTVALAVKNNGLDTRQYPNLSKAYAAAVALTKTATKQADEDAAAEKAVQSIAKSAPASAETPEGAARIVLSKGVDEAARLLLDALGATNSDAHRAFMRAVAEEVAGRNKPAPKTKAAPAGPKEGTVTPKAKPTGAAKKAAAVKAKPKPVGKPKVEQPALTDTEIEADKNAAEARAEIQAQNQAKAKAKPVLRGRPARPVVKK